VKNDSLITYLLLAIYCQEEHDERVSIARVRELRIKIRNELPEMMVEEADLDGCIAGTIGAPPSHASP